MCLHVGMSVCERLCLGFIGVCVSSCVQIDVDVSMCVCVCACVRVCACVSGKTALILREKGLSYECVTFYVMEKITKRNLCYEIDFLDCHWI